MRIFAPAIAVGVLLLAYSVYWYVTAKSVQDNLEAWSARSKAGDVVVSWRDLSVGGYPYRIQADFVEPQASAPNTPEAWAWSADTLEADLLPYNLRHIVLKVDGAQRFSYRDVSDGSHHLLRVTSGGTWASYVALDNVPLGRVAIDIRDLLAKLDEAQNGVAPFVMAATRLQLHARPSSEAENVVITPDMADSCDVALQGDNMVVDTGTPTIFGPHIALFTAQARLSHLPQLNAASPVQLIRAWRLQGGDLAISSLQLKWGALDMQASGKLNIDDQNRLQGNLQAEIANYSALISALVEAGVVKQRDAKLAEMGVGLFAQFQGGKAGSVRLPLKISEGTIYLGPLPIGKLNPLF